MPTPSSAGTAGPNWSSHLQLVGMAALWGASWSWGRVVAQAMPPLTAAALRFVLACLVLVPWLLRKEGLATVRALTPRHWGALTAASLTGILGYSSFFMLALQYVPASKGALVIAVNPAITLLFAAWIYRERINPVIGLGMVLSVTGALLVISHGDPWSLLSGGLGLGEGLLLCGVLSWVAYTLIGRGMTGVDGLTTTAVTAVIGGAMLVVLSLVVEGPAAYRAAFQAPGAAWICLALLAFAATALAYAWFLNGVKVLGAGAAAAYITLVPVFGVSFSAMWLGEHIDPSLLVGGGLAIVGMAVMSVGRR